MPATQSDIDALNAAIRQGERMVRFADGRSVEYRSVADLITVRNYAAAELARSNPHSRQTRLYHAGRGYRWGRRRTRARRRTRPPHE